MKETTKIKHNLEKEKNKLKKDFKQETSKMVCEKNKLEKDLKNKFHKHTK